MAKTPEEMTVFEQCALIAEFEHSVGTNGIGIAAAIRHAAKAPATPAPIAEKPCECMTVHPQFCPKHGIKPVALIAAQTEKVAWKPCGQGDHIPGPLCADCRDAAAEQVDAARLEKLARSIAEKLRNLYGEEWTEIDAIDSVEGVILEVLRAASLKQETQPRESFVTDNLTDDDPSASSSPLETPAAVTVAEIAGIPNVPAMVHQAERFDDKAKAWAEELHEIIFDPVNPDNDAIETIALTLKNFAESEIVWRNAGK